MSEARQGASILLVDSKPTVFGGFNNYDNYPTLVEQFDPALGTEQAKSRQGLLLTLILYCYRAGGSKQLIT